MVELSLDDMSRDPYPMWARLRAEAPVAYSPSLERYLVTRYADIVELEKTPEVFSSREEDSLLTRVVGHNMLREDNAPHHRIRSAAEPPTRPRQVRDIWSTAFATNCGRVLEDLAPRGRGDLIADFISPLVELNLAAVLGIGGVPRGTMTQWSAHMMAGNGNYADDQEIWARAKAATAEIDEYVRLAVDRVQGSADDSIISAMVHADDPLPLDEVQNNVKVIIGGGINEPLHVFGTGAWQALTDPALRARLVDDPALWRKVFEESARWISPIGLYPRQVLSEYEVAGIRLPAGSRVALVIGSGNRDSAVIQNADVFDIDREPVAHLAFGGGPHFCMGAWVARHQIGALAWPAVFDRLRGLRLVEGFEPEISGWVFRGLKSLPVEWEAVG
ncbi:cytochrome P450 [Nocardioides luti]